MAFNVKNTASYDSKYRKLKDDIKEKRSKIDTTIPELITIVIILLAHGRYCILPLFQYFFEDTFFTFFTAAGISILSLIIGTVLIVVLVDRVIFPLLIYGVYQIILESKLHRIKKSLMPERRKYLDSIYNKFLNYMPDEKILKK